MSKRNLRRTLGAMLLIGGLLAPGATQATMINLAAGENLQARIDGATGGDILLLGTGTYGGFKIVDRHFTPDRPLVIRAAPGATPVIRGRDYRGYLAFLNNSSYVVFDGLTLEHCNQPVYAKSIDHFILVNLEIHDTGQEAIHLRGDSHDVDIRNCRIHDTGHTEPQWAEGIYIGMGQQPYESVEKVWIEGNDISATGNSEGVNVKARSYHITIRGNKVHDIAPGTATQYNEAAISCESADLGFRPGVDPDIWIERNEIYHVRYGRWANGIKVSTMGGKIIHNDIHDCEQFGVEFNDYENGPGVFTTWLFDNTITRCAAGALSRAVLPVKNEDPGPNPNRPQTWYESAQPAVVMPAMPPPGGPAAGSDLVSPDRLTRWNPGLPGGIPVVTTIFATIDASVYGQGKTDATVAINRAIQAAGTVATATNLQVVYLPAGTYRISDSILLDQSHVVLRGAGPGLTKIIGIPGEKQASIRVGWKWNYTGLWDVVGDVPKGSTSITVSDASTIEVGDVLQIDQQDDLSYVRILPDSIYRKRQPATGKDGPGTGGAPGVTGGPWRSVAQQIEVASKHGNTLGLSGPVHIAFEAKQKPQVFKTATARTGEPGTRFVGIEDLYVSGGTYDNIIFVNTAYCWVRNIESDGRPLDADHGVSRQHVNLEHAYRCEIRDSYFHHARFINYGGNAYGISIGDESSDNLVENNISVHLNKPIIMNASGGGNVIAYNYADNAYSVNSPGWQENCIDGNHECFPHYELFEGNWAGNLGSDCTHGNSGWHMWFRNYSAGRNSAPPSPDAENMRAVGVDGWNRSYTFVGNVLNVQTVNGVPRVYECAADGPCMNADAVYRIGANALKETGTGLYHSFDDGAALAQLYRHGNWDSVHNAVVWDPRNPNHTLPASLYLTKKPAFFGDLPWPWVGPDLNPMIGTLPAKARYDAGKPNLVEKANSAP